MLGGGRVVGELVTSLCHYTPSMRLIQFYLCAFNLRGISCLYSVKSSYRENASGAEEAEEAEVKADLTKKGEERMRALWSGSIGSTMA